MGKAIEGGFRLFIAIGLILTPSLQANDSLIAELESLRKTLRPKDPSHSTLTRRLADLYFDAVIAMDKDNILKGITAPTKKLLKYQKKAISLYHEALSVNRDKYKKDRTLVIKIWFQLARLYFLSGKKQRTIQYYRKILGDKKTPVNLARESSLQMAEHMEAINKFNESYKYYRLALKLCSGDICSYANYRLAWLLYRQQMYPEAVEEGRKALWDAKGQIREYALKDFVVFLSNMPGDGSEQLTEVDNLANVLKRPSLLRDLAIAFFAAGNQKAGVNVLAVVNKRTPAFSDQMRLAEEYYGMRNWLQLRLTLDQMAAYTDKSLPSKKETVKEIKKTLKRLIVQLDGELHGRKESKSYLQDSIFIYLNVFLKDLAMREKLIDGWLAVENDVSRKVEQLAVWIKEEKRVNNKKEEIRLRKIRLSLAQELKDQEIIIEEGLALANLLVEPKESRHHFYLVARVYYEKKEYEKAKTLFAKLARKGSEATVQDGPDKWAILSLNLLLDILNT
ncbi:MAG: tetratricopeptide repeat protein [Halobacteriovoraceae bacterium]|nr:tetratricopeptide repeat protein [Halobacteriovoraceae bacterium]